MPVVNREKRKGGRTRLVNRRDDDHEDGSDDGTENITVSIDEFMGWAQNAISKGDTGAIARLRADLIEARRKKNYWKNLYEQAMEETPEDAVVLVDKEAEAVNKIRDRKIDLSKLDDLISKFENDNATLTAENVKFKSRALYTEYGQVSGYNVDAIEGAVTNEHLHAEMGEVKVEKTDANGKKSTEQKKTLMVRKANDPKAPLVPFDEYIEKNAKWMVPALKTTDGQQQKQSGAFFPEQTPTGDGQQGGMLSKFLERVNAANAPQRSSPLDQGAHRTQQPPQQRHASQRA